MEYKIEHKPPSFLETAFVAMLLGAVLVGVLHGLSKALSPQAFADAAQTRAEIPAQVQHLEEMNTLTEQDTANRVKEAAKRRAFWTGAMLAITAAVGLAALGLGFRVASVSVARGVQALREIPRQPLPVELRNGYTALPDTLTGHLLDERTGRVSGVTPTAESPARARLEQVDSVGKSAVEAARANRRAGDWLNGTLQEMSKIEDEVTK